MVIGYRWVFKVIKYKDNHKFDIREGVWFTDLKSNEICTLLLSWGWDEVIFLMKTPWVVVNTVENFPKMTDNTQVVINGCI